MGKRKQKIKMEDITRFRGLFKDYTFNNINDTNVNILVEKGAISLNMDLEKQPPDIQECFMEEFSEQSTKLEFPIFFNLKEYYINPIILDDIFNIIKYNVKFINLHKDKEKEKIEQKLFSIVSTEKKIKYLNKKIKKIINKIDDFSYYKIYLNPDHWEDYFKFHIENNHITLNHYLTSARKTNMDYYYEEYSYYQTNMVFSRNNLTFKTWLSFHKANELTKFCYSELQKLNNNNNKILSQKSKNHYELNNIKENYNRNKLVFKTPYNCELFIYMVNELSNKNSKIIFSYLFEIFKSENLFNNKMDINEYLYFLNNEFKLNETRLRTNLSTPKYNKYLNFYNKCNNEFKEKLNKISS